MSSGDWNWGAFGGSWGSVGRVVGFAGLQTNHEQQGPPFMIGMGGGVLGLWGGLGGVGGIWRTSNES